MLHPRVKGAYYQIGFSEGSLLHKMGFRVPTPSRERADFGRDCEYEVSRIFPEIIDEMRGFGDACQVAYEDVLALVLGYGAFGSESVACSIFAVANDSGVVFGRNYDFYYKFREQSMAHLTCPDGNYASVGDSAISTGREGGVNERGLAIAVSAVEEKTVKAGVNFAVAVRYVLDKCGNVKEAVRALSEMPHSTAMNFLLADKEGNLAVAEAAAGKVRIREPDQGNGFIVCTNHFLHRDMLEMENRRKRDWDSEVRYRAIYGTLKSHRGEIDVAGAQAILSDHSGYVCFHDREKGLGTLWSVVAELTQLKIYRAEGHPCRNKYKEDFRLNRAIGLREG